MHDSRTLVCITLGQLEGRVACFDGISQALHWLTVLLVIGQFASAFLHGQRHGAAAELLLTFHRSAGVATWIVVAMRLLWRRWFTDLNEYGQYLLLLSLPLTGLAAMLVSGHPFVLFLWQVPALMAQDKPLAHLLKEAHETGAWILAALIGLHAAAALFDSLVLRDRVLPRMPPEV